MGAQVPEEGSAEAPEGTNSSSELPPREQRGMGLALTHHCSPAGGAGALKASLYPPTCPTRSQGPPPLAPAAPCCLEICPHSTAAAGLRLATPTMGLWNGGGLGMAQVSPELLCALHASYPTSANTFIHIPCAHRHTSAQAAIHIFTYQTQRYILTHLLVLVNHLNGT